MTKVVVLMFVDVECCVSKWMYCMCVFNVVHHILSNDRATKSLNCHSRSLFWVALLETEGERTQKQG